MAGLKPKFCWNKLEDGRRPVRSNVKRAAIKASEKGE